MVRRSSLGAVVDRPEPAPQAQRPEVSQPPVADGKPARAKRAAIAEQPRATQAEAPAAGGSRYAGQVHVGASYGETDDTVNAFRELAFRERRSTKDLLHEAMQLVVAKYDRYKPPQE